MDLLPHLLTYYRGERLNAIAMLIAGLVFLALFLLVWRQAAPGSMARGLLYPLALLALIGIGAGPFLLKSNNARLERLPQELARDPDAFIAKDTVRITGVNKAWLPLKATWTAVLLVGVALAFAGGTPYWKGLGIGLVLVGAMGHAIDGFASDRAYRYLERLRSA